MKDVQNKCEMQTEIGRNLQRRLKEGGEITKQAGERIYKENIQHF
jgi:hypothetical protein